MSSGFDPGPAWRRAAAFLSARWQPGLAGAAVLFALFQPLNCPAPGGGFPGAALLLGLDSREVLAYAPFYPFIAESLLALGFSPEGAARLFHGVAYLAALGFGAAAGGPLAGLAGLVGAVVFLYLLPGYDCEQVVYAFSLLLAQWGLLKLAREGTARAALLCGLGIGFTLLVRTPLFAFPPLAACYALLGPGPRRARVKRALLIVAAAYALLLPRWAVTAYHFGGGRLLEGERAASNLVSAAKGSVFTMEGDFRKLAGLGPGDSPASYYVGEALRAPGSFSLAVLRRAWQIFLFTPWLLSALALAAVFSREPRKGAFLLLPAYFAAAHALLSVEERYFHPFALLLPPLIAGLWRGPAGAPPGKNRLGPWLFAAAAAPALLLQVLIAVYPSRALAGRSYPEKYAAASSRFPWNEELHWEKCGETRALSGEGAFRSCLAEHAARFGDQAAAYFLAVTGAGSAARIPPPPPRRAGRADQETPLLAIKLLGELWYRDTRAARRTLEEAKAAHAAEMSMLRGRPYARDREISEALGSDFAHLAEVVRSYLALWPPAEAKELGKKLAALGDAGGAPGPVKVLFRPEPARDAAQGDKKLCFAGERGADKNAALEACRRIVIREEARGGQGAAASAQAQYRACELLKELGRAEEAEAALYWLRATAPRGR